MNFPKEELNDMVYAIGESDGNCVLAARVYSQKYPTRRQPQIVTFRRLKERFAVNSSVNYLPPSKQKYVLTENNRLNVLMTVVEQPGSSQRQISKDLNISRSSIQKCLKENKFHAYHPHIVQELREEDFPRRVLFSEWALGRIADDEFFFQNVLFTDESTFQKSALPNRHNVHQYSDINPHFKFEKQYQGRWSINVWGGIIGTQVVGPYFFDGSINGRSYGHFLRNDLFHMLEDVPLLTRAQMWFQHDGAPAHFAAEVRNYLNEYFRNRWIGRGGPVPWPPRSPDLTPLDFSLWGYVKDLVYATPPTTAENMCMRIVRVFREIPEQMMRNIQASYENRLRSCLNQNGQHFEHLLN